MYFNIKLIAEKELTLKDILNLQLIHQNKTEDHSLLLESTVSTSELQKYQERAYIEYVKPKKKGQSPAELLRLSSKGKELLENIQTPEISGDTLKIFEWVKGIYTSTGREVGNSKKCKMYIEQFSKESSIYQNELALLIKAFLDDEKEFEYSRKLQFLFFKGESIFSVRFDLNSSRLYQYYQKNQKHFDNKFAQLN